MNESNVPKEKEWAVNLSQNEFEKEWHRRSFDPFLVPDKDDWIKRESPKNNCIDGFSADSLILEDIIPKKQRDKEYMKRHTTQIEKCKYCSREIKSKIALYTHEQKCKKFYERLH